MKRMLFLTSLVLLFLTLTTNVFAQNYVAEAGGVKYETLSGAISAAGTTSTTITLIDNINLDGKLSFPKGSNIVLDLNGKSLTVPTVENNYGIVVGGNLTIKGSGTVSLGMYGIGVQPSGNLTIEDGTYKCLSGDYLLGSWGTTTIKGGLFDGNYCIANGFDGGTVKILDGTFYSKEATIVLGGTEIYGGAFNQNVEEYLAEGIEMKMYNGLYFTGEVYKITVTDSEHGKVTTLSEAVAEQPVKVTATPNGGYELSNIKVTDKDGKLIAVRSGEFVMPASDVTVLAIFESTTLDNTPQTGNGYIITITSILSGIVVIAFIGIVTKRKLKNN
ncbi:MAG: hypothetical protein IJ272_03275 [Clostridia bacterium]|nr:hypothetical protein [Clostridia bacterium]